MEALFPGFEPVDIVTGDGIAIHGVRGGEGPPLLLLHGNPQSHVMWHKVAPALARRHTVVATDLRGYGGSDKPAGGADHAAYSKRTMAQDQVEVMAALGHRRFAVAGHDRGARVTHRMALDHPERVAAAAVLDIVPTLEMYDRTNRDFALLYWTNFFYAQPVDLPERLIAGDPDRFVESNLFDLGDDARIFDLRAVEAYKQAFRDPATIHAACEDYRASFSIDREHDAADLGRRLASPLLVLWGARGVMERCFDVMALWRDKASELSGHRLDAGHYLAEERPHETAAQLLSFFDSRT